MIWETVLISAGITIITNILVELGKYLKTKSKCKIKVEIGGGKSEDEIIKLKK
jgi:hypothetical protein